MAAIVADVRRSREDFAWCFHQLRRFRMALQIRRVVTGHDATGRAIVTIDETAKNPISSRSGATSCVVWTTQGFPVNNDSEEDEGAAQDRHDARQRHSLSRARASPRGQ